MVPLGIGVLIGILILLLDPKSRESPHRYFAWCLSLSLIVAIIITLVQRGWFK